METWYSKLGFYNNPFSIKPAAFHDELIAYDLEYVYGKIDDGEMVFIDGSYGSGKTTILKNIIHRYGGEKRVVYYNFNRHDEFDVKKLVDGANTLLKKLLGMNPKSLIVLLDEVVTIGKADAKRLLKYYDDGVVKSIIFVNNSYKESKLPPELEERVAPNIIRTRDLNGDEAILLIRKRIGEIDLLTDSIIKTIFARSGNNPRKFLENSEDICKYAIEKGDLKVTLKHVDAILKGQKAKQSKEKRARKVVAKKAPAAEEVKEQDKPAPEVGPSVYEKTEKTVQEKAEVPKDEFDFIKDEIEVINLEDVQADKKKKKQVDEYEIANYDIFED